MNIAIFLLLVLAHQLLSRPLDDEPASKKIKPENPSSSNSQNRAHSTANSSLSVTSQSAKCFFSVEKISSHETFPRDSYTKVSTNCEGIPQKWADAIGTFSGDFHGASNEMDLIAARGSAEYPDFTDPIKFAEIGHSDDLRAFTFEQESDQWTVLRAKLFEDLMSNVVSEYQKQTTRKERRGLLSLVAVTLPYSTIQKYFPNLSRYEFSKARMHAVLLNQNPYTSNKRQKFNKEHIADFVDFITSPLIRSDLPYGRRTLTKSDGTKLEISNTLRNIRSIEIVEMYIKMKSERSEQDQLLSRSTLFRILEVCKATNREALECVDYFVSDALDSFDKLFGYIKTIKEKSYIDESTAKDLDKRLHNAKLYLQTDFKLHLKPESKVADHCVKYALSDPSEQLFSEECASGENSHDHKSHQCERCQSVRNVFEDFVGLLKELIETAEKNTLRDSADENVKAKADLTIMLNDAKMAETNVLELRKHLIRNKPIMEVRQKIVEGMKSDEAFLTLDWAQKILPHQARESQSDYFGKSGISAHATHALNVDSRCYHSAKTITSLPEIAKRTGVKILSFTFSEAQGGKGAADRATAEMKRKLRTWLASGKDASTPDEVFTALTEGRVPKAMSTHLVSVDRASVQEGQTSIKGIQNFYDFWFNDTKNEMIARKFGLIGKGEVKKTNSFVPSRGTLKIEKCGGFLPSDATTFWKHSKCTGKCSDGKDDSSEDMMPFGDKDVDVEASDPKPMETAVFTCPEEACDATFLKESNLEKHIALGKHKVSPERETLLDVAMTRFAENVEGMKEGSVSSMLKDAFVELPAGSLKFVAEKGWAHPSKKSNKRYDVSVVEFVMKRFETASKNKQKVYPKVIAEEIKEKKNADGTSTFAPEVWLNYKQVLNLFHKFGKKSRELAAKEKTQAVESEKEKENGHPPKSSSASKKTAPAPPTAASPTLSSLRSGATRRPKRETSNLANAVIEELNKEEYDDSEDVYDTNDAENNDYSNLMAKIEEKKLDIFSS